MAFRTIEVELVASDAGYRQTLQRAAEEERRFVAQVNQSGRTASTAMDGASRSTATFTDHQRKAGDAGRKMGEDVASGAHKAWEGLNKIVQTAAGFELAIGFQEAAGKIRDFTTEAVREGINLNVSLGRTKTIFGQQAEGVIADVDHMGERFGTNNAQMLRIVDTFGVVARGAGVTGAAAAELSTNLAHVAADTAAFWRQSPDQVMVAIRSGLLGMTRGIKAYGVELSTTSVQQKAVELGLVRTGQALTEGEKVQARAAIIQEQLATTTGYLAAHTETFAGQLRLLRGHLANFIEEAGARSLPVLSSMLLQARHLGSEALPILDRAIAALSPTGRGLVAIGSDLWDILLKLGHVVAPLAVGLAALGAAGIIGGLNLLVGSLAAVTDFLAHHQAIVITLAALYGATFIPRVLALAAAFRFLLGMQVFGFFRNATTAVELFTTAEGRATLGAAAMTAGLALVIAAAINLNAHASKSGKGLADAIFDQPAASLAALRKQLDQTQQQIDKTVAHPKPDFFDFGHVFDIFGTHLTKEAGQHAEAKKNLDAHRTSLNNWSENLTMVAAAAGTTTDRVERLAAATGVDLTKGIGQSGPERQKLIDTLLGIKGSAGPAADAVLNLGTKSEQMAKDLSDALGSVSAMTKLSSDQIVSMFGDDAQAVKAFGDEVTKVMDQTRQAWTGDADLIGTVSSQLAQDVQTRAANAKAIAAAHVAGAKSSASASDALTKAEERLAAVQDARGHDKNVTTADNNKLADATRNLAKAQDAAAASGKAANVTAVPAAVTRVVDFYKTAITQAKGFSSAINEAVQRGVDPQLIARLLEAGPKQAEPVLQAILSDHSGKIIGMVNDSEHALQTITDQAVEMARLTAIAIKSPTDKIAKDLRLAMQAAQREAASGGTLTAEALAKSLGVGLEKVQELMTEYGITVATGINPVLAAVGAQQLNITGAFATPGHGGKADALAHASGGYHEDHSPVIARGGPARVWNEPETGGEAYIPLSPMKRAAAVPVFERVASEFGAHVHFADGGLVPPPSFEGLGYFGVGAHGADEKLYEAAQRFLQTKALGSSAGGPGGPAAAPTGRIGHGWPALLTFLSAFRDPYTVTSTTGGKHAAGSLHYAGRAADFVGPSMMRLAQDFLTDQGDLAELFYTPLGYSIKNGRRVSPIAAAEHFNHVHAATYDQGGMLPPGLTMAWNGTGRPEPVGHSEQLASAIGKELRSAVAAIPRGPLIGEQTFNERVDPKHVAHEVAWVAGW